MITREIENVKSVTHASHAERYVLQQKPFQTHLLKIPDEREGLSEFHAEPASAKLVAAHACGLRGLLLEDKPLARGFGCQLFILLVV